MLDPVRAHELYMKERLKLTEEAITPLLEMINKMQKTIDKQSKKNATLKHEMKRVINSTKEKK